MFLEPVSRKRVSLPLSPRNVDCCFTSLCSCSLKTASTDSHCASPDCISNMYPSCFALGTENDTRLVAEVVVGVLALGTHLYPFSAGCCFCWLVLRLLPTVFW